ISELKGAKPSRSGLARLHDAEQAVYDFPHWIYVCGKRYTAKDFPEVTPEAALRHQIEVVKTRQVWAKNPEEYFSEMGKIYYCKGLVWLCYNIHQLSSKQGPFSWAELQRETNKDTESLTKILMKLKSDNWNYASINKALPNLYKLADELIKKYG
ncbi:MAG TPA: hypothetical protein VLF88_02845, partial [Candidatus Babeliales bacterium]|nr:hypothetical protein [Candidatus Babeliales bacterium]